MKKRRNQSTKSEKGLTLITLIVMIIILVILSAIVIRGITGEEGLIKTTKEVALTQEIQEYKERITEEVRGAVVKYAAIGEEIGLEEIAEEIDEQTTWVKSTILNINTKTTNDDILVGTIEGYVFQIFYDSMYNVVNVEYIGNEDGEAFPELLASFERTTSIINATASDSKNEIIKTEIIFRGESIEPNGSQAANSLTHKGEESGWYIIKTTSSIGKLRYAWIRANLKSNGLTPPEIEIVSAGLPGQDDWYGQDNQPVVTRIYTTNPRAKRIHYEISGVSPAKTEEAPGKEVTLEGINKPGSTYIIAWTLDDKGGESDPTRYEVKYDNVKPEIITIQETGDTKETDNTTEGEQEETRWYKSEVGIQITEYQEEHSGVVSYSYQKQGADAPTYVKDITRAQTVISEGKTVVTFALQDKAGNQSAPETVTIYKDTIAPIQFQPTITEETSNSFKIHVSTQDGGNPDEASGIAYYDIYVHETQGDKKVKESLKNKTGEYEATGLTPGTSYTVFAVAYDKAGNNTTSQTVNKTTALPLLAPRVEVTGTHNTGYENSGWYKTATVTVTDTAKQTLGATGATQLRLTGSHNETKPMDANGQATFQITAEGGNLQVTAYAVNSSGTQSTGTNSETFKRDGTAPTMNGNPTATPATLTSITITPTTAQDTVSGLQGYKYYVDGTLSNSTPTTSINYAATTTTGNHSVGVKAVDNAGNETEASTKTNARTLQYTWSKWTATTVKYYREWIREISGIGGESVANCTGWRSYTFCNTENRFYVCGSGTKLSEANTIYQTAFNMSSSSWINSIVKLNAYWVRAVNGCRYICSANRYDIGGELLRQNTVKGNQNHGYVYENNQSAIKNGASGRILLPVRGRQVRSALSSGDDSNKFFDK